MKHGRQTTNELEFQGQVLGWLNEEIRRRPGLHLDRATQEKPRRTSGKRSDLIVWKDRATEVAFLAMELKTPATPVNDPTLFADAIEKAQHWKAPYLAIWNMRAVELYKTPRKDQTLTPADAIKRWPQLPTVTKLDDWLNPEVSKHLKSQCLNILQAAWDHAAEGPTVGHVIDPEIFVARLSDALGHLRTLLYQSLKTRAAKDAKLRRTMNRIAAEQGFKGFVEDIEFAIAGQIGYRLIGQILFYFALRRKQPSLRPLALQPCDELPAALRPFWNDVRRFDYEALFKPDQIEDLVPVPPEAQRAVRDLIDHLAHYDWASLTDDVLGAVFQQLIPRAEQILLGQFYTPRPVANLLVALTADGESPLFLDPGCGSGTFLMGAYEYLAHRSGMSHKDILPIVWGFDLSPFSAELAAINLFRQDLAEFDNFPRIVPGNFFDRQPGQPVEFPPPRVTAHTATKIPIPIPHFDCIVGNPPYLRSQNQDDLDPKYRHQLFRTAAAVGIKADPKTDLFAFFIYHAMRFMKPGSRLGFVTPASWLTSNYAVALPRLLLTDLRLLALVSSSAESFFPQVDVNTVLLVAERVENPQDANAATLRFVNLKQPIARLAEGQTWQPVTALADFILGQETSMEDERLRIKLVPLKPEKDALCNNPKTPRNWSKFMRAPLSYYTLFGKGRMNRFIPLSDLAKVSLGYKSLQNDFFYVNEATAATYKIEPRFLRPITLFKDLQGSSYLQNPPATTSLFLCREEEPDLRGTGALRYIHAMSERPAAEKKQSGRPKTIREVLEAQSGGLWYAPKATPHTANIWLRKAFNTVYAPFVFKTPRVLDQRCNYIRPIRPVTWELLAAVLTSTTFAYGLEINGSASMGAGALEAPTSKLRSYPVFDPRPLSPDEKKELIRLAHSVWSAEEPPDWAAEGTQPGSKLRALDEWLLNRAAVSLTADQVYSDLRATCAARIAVAQDKVKTTKKQKTDSVSSVARGIAEPIALFLNSRQFPEDFGTPSETIPFHVARGALRQIKIHSFFDNADITLIGEGGHTLLEGSYDASVAEAIARAVLLGRQAFQAPAKRAEAQACLSEFLAWFRQIRTRLDEAIAESALGTGYEDQLRAQVYQTLRIHPLAGEPTLPALINCTG